MLAVDIPAPKPFSPFSSSANSTKLLGTRAGAAILMAMLKKSFIVDARQREAEGVKSHGGAIVDPGRSAVAASK